MTFTITESTATKLHALANHIELHDRFSYGEWVATRADEEGALEEMEEGVLDAASQLSTHCNAVGCVAGWAIDLAATEGHSFRGTDVEEVAAHYLGLGGAEKLRLFYGRAAHDAGVIHRGLHPLSVGMDAVGAAKMLRTIADGHAEGWEVVPDADA